MNIDGESVDAFIGLAPSSSEDYSYINALVDDGTMEDAIIGLSYQPYSTSDKNSTIQFGFIDNNQVEGGSSAMKKFNNIGIRSWGFEIDKVSYDEKEISDPAMTLESPIFAKIDSANISIQLNEKMYDSFYAELKKAESFTGIKFKTKTEHNHEILVVENVRCSAIENRLKPLSF